MADSGRVHVVVGASPSGIILARSLADAGERVVLIEQGPETAHAAAAPSAVERFCNIHAKSQVWSYQCYDERKTPQLVTSGVRAIADRRLSYPQAMGLGGNSNVNAMIFSTGHGGVYDRFWPRSWSSSFVRVMESRVLALTGYTEVRTSGLMRSVIQSVREASPNSQRDFASECYTTSMNACRSARAGMGILVLGRPGVILRTGCVATKVEVSNGAAVGVVVTNELGAEERVDPSGGGEIVLAAGAFMTPRLLVATGLPVGGDPGSPHATFGLQDHTVLPFLVLGSWFAGWTADPYPVSSVHGWVYLDEDGAVWDDASRHPLPRCQLLFLDGTGAAGLVEMIVPRFASPSVAYALVRPLLVSALQAVASFCVVRWLCSFVFGALVCLVQPSRQGSLRVDRRDLSLAAEPPTMGAEGDAEAMAKAMNAARTFIRRHARGPELVPGPLFAYAHDATWFRRFSSLLASTYFHPCGTFPLPTQTATAGSVGLDEELRVRGVAGLRVADASVIPHIPTAPIAATSMVIGAAAAEFLLHPLVRGN